MMGRGVGVMGGGMVWQRNVMFSLYFIANLRCSIIFFILSVTRRNSILTLTTIKFFSLHPS